MNSFYTSTEAADITKCSRRQLQHWRDIGMVEPIVNPSGKGRNVYYSPSDLLALVVMEHLLSMGLCFDLCAFVLKYLKKNEVWFFDDFSEHSYRSKRKHWIVLLDRHNKIGYRVIDLDPDWEKDGIKSSYDQFLGEFIGLNYFGREDSTSCCGVVGLWSDLLCADLQKRLNDYEKGYQTTRWNG